MSMNIYVGNLSFETAEPELRALFEAYGSVDSVKIITDQFSGRSRGFGFVEMAQRDEGMKAIHDLDSKEIGGRALKVNEARPKRQGGDGRGRDSRW